LDDLNTSRFVRPVGLVHDYMPFVEKYEVLEQIGSGGFAVVRKAKHRATGDVVAVKTLRVQGMGAESDEEDGDDSSSSSSDEEDGPQAMTLHDVKRELVMMQQLSTHPNIVTIREFFTEQNDEVVHVVMDCLQGEELDDWVNERGPIPEDVVKTLMMSMLDAVAFMHSKGVIHRDLKLENFVFAEKGNLKSLNVVDFGLAKALNARQKAQHVCGTLSYIAPEALLAGVYGQGVDVWALGVAMHVLLTNTWPFDDEDEDELFEQIIECDLDFETEAWEGVSEIAKDLIEGLLDSRPKHRLTAAQALEHEWFTGQSSHTSDRLHNMHARLDSLISISNQPPERRFKDGEYITRQGDPSIEFFIIIAGECTLTRDGVGVGVRRVGNFVGELRNLEQSVDDVVLTAWTSARAVGDVRVLVFHDTELQWAHQHDYRLTYEFENMIRSQRRAIAKQAREQRKCELAMKAAELETVESTEERSMMRSVSAQPLVGEE
jgi:serine/threonine protein kinase